MSTNAMFSPPRTRTRRRRLLSAGVATAVAVAGLVAVSSPAATAATPDASAILTAPPQLHGVDKVRPGDNSATADMVATTVDGRQCWQMQNDPAVRYVYVDVADAAIPAGATRAIVTVDYHDVGTAGMLVNYNSTTNAWANSSLYRLTDTSGWKSHSFELTDIKFTNRANGSDFRVQVQGADGAIPPVCISGISVRFTDQPIAALDSLAIMSPSLIFKEGQASVDVATPAEEVSWRLGDADDVELRTGTAAVADGEGSIDLKDLPFGYYTLSVTADVGEPVTRTTSLAVLDDPPAGWNDGDAFFGTQIHRGHQPTAQTEALMDAMVLAGYGKSRIETTWGEVEKTKGQYDFSGEGVRVVGELADRGQQVMWNAGLTSPLYDGNRTPASPEAISAFAAYVGATAAHYSAAGDSHDIGILNEYNSSGFNNGTCGLTAACYLDILKPTFTAAHAADAKANVIAPITAGVQLAWAKDFIAQGGLDHLDTYATNYYGYSEHGAGTPPEQASDLKNLEQLTAMIDEADGDRDIPVRITENGWPTHDAGSTQEQQADYAIRGPLLAQLAGADEYLWYDLYDDGFNSGEREDRFGLINRADDTACYLWKCPGDNYTYGAVHGISPKPGFVSQAVAIRQTVGKTPAGREDLGSDSLYSLRYTGDRAADTTRVLWSTGTDSVQINSGNGYVLTDQFGRSRNVPKGSAVVQLTGSPVFVTGDATVAPSAPLVDVSVAESSVQGADLPVTVTVADGADIKGGELTVAASGVQKKVNLADTGKVSLTLPGVTRLGEREVAVTLTDKKGRLVSEGRGKTAVVDPFSVSARPSISTEAGGYAYSLDVSVVNNAANTDLTIDSFDWKVGNLSGTVTQGLTVPGGATKSVSVPIDDPKLYTTQTASVVAHSGELTRSDSGPISFSPIEKDGAQTLDPIDLNTIGKWNPIRSGTRTGPADLGGGLQYTATQDALVMRATITDDVHQADRTDPALSWQADSVQFNTYDLFPTVLGGERVEIAAALYASGPIVYTFTPPAGQKAGLTPGATAEIVRDEDAGTTTYDVSVPWSSLGYDGPPSGVWGLSFLVNDADGDIPGTDARAGYLEWGAGVGAAPKNPALFKSVQLVG
ncbi:MULTISPECIES: hypothetical protein [unclassified Microbacterium]|uniref:hypothetical protein n=1 Tax=unclassified Microbacterium TaxID=2609290 RepID=UPI0012F8F316|nr:hypothetical protein [Microbacterium sp. MAH-37]MVQ44076.1 hypothetical protein [Microbacterium sp. MAH-37]